MRILCFIVAWVCSSVLFAQNDEPVQILLLNGRYLEVYHLNDSSYVPLQYDYDKNFFRKERINLRAARKADQMYMPSFSTPEAENIPVVLKKGSTDRGDVFSITYPSGREVVWYEVDSLEGDFRSKTQMRAYVYGERDARYFHRGRGWFYSGLAVGLAAGYGSRGSILALAVPPVFALSTKIPVVRIREHQISDKTYKYNEDYAAGFESVARSRNAVQALKGSAIGTIVGMLTYTLINRE